MPFRNSSIKENPRSKLILIKGSPLDLEKRLHQSVYFDKQGVLTSKLGIKHVPAIVMQRKDVAGQYENVLRITEGGIDG